MKTSVIVTGASSGIGQAVAIRLAADFEQVALAARGRNGLNETADRVRNSGAEPLQIEADLSEPAAADHVIETVRARFGRIDALVNVAGAVPGIDLFQMTDEEWAAGAELKLHGARRLTLRAWDALKASGGAVVFTSGVAAEAPSAAMAAVGVINAAIEALSKAFADRGIIDGVQVNTMSPGAVMTRRRQMMIGKFAEKNALNVDEAEAKMLAAARIARYGEPEEIANAVAFLVSPASRWLTGTCLRVDGGEIKAV